MRISTSAPAQGRDHRAALCLTGERGHKQLVLHEPFLPASKIVLLLPLLFLRAREDKAENLSGGGGGEY